MHARQIITLALALSIAPPVVSFADAAVAGPTKSAAPKTRERAKRLTLVGIENGVRFVAQSQPKEIITGEGIPVRATCTVKIKEASRASFKRGTAGASG